MTGTREFNVDVDLEENRLTIVERREIDELFDKDGELRLCTEATGWRGFRRKETADGWSYYIVDTTRDEDDWARAVRVGEKAVINAVTEHVAAPRTRIGRSERRVSAASGEKGRPVCRFCGTWIPVGGQRCPALDDGRCAP